MSKISELYLKSDAHNKLEDLGLETIEEVKQHYEDGKLEKEVGKKAYKEIVKALEDM